MIDLVFPPERSMAENWEEIRAWLMSFYAAQDSNRDGKLDLAELTARPLATFECMDTNHDEVLSEAEIQTGRGNCPSYGFDRDVGFILQPRS